MIYVEILGRMGNQMFSYAFARTLQQKYRKYANSPIVFDYSNYEFQEKNCLKNYKCSKNIIEGKRKYNIIQKIVLHIYYQIRNKSKLKTEKEILNFESKWQDFLSIFGIYVCYLNYHNFRFRPLTKNVLLIGFFESPDFFKEIDSELKTEFKPINENYSPIIKNWIKLIENTNSVCVGIRRGDFVSNSNMDFCNVCKDVYYERAIDYMLELNGNARFFVFTDDPEWVKGNVTIPEGSIIIGDDLIRYDDKLYVMSKCKHFIISNSTYVWWAQHLSDYPDKIVIAPDSWRNNTPETHTGIYENNWKLISPD